MLRINVGFLLKQATGYSRDIEVDTGPAPLDADLRLNDVRGQLRLTRTHDGVLVTGILHGGITFECDRCLIDYTQKLTARVEDLYYYPPEHYPEAELHISEDGNLDLWLVVRENFLLDIPIRHVCRPDCKGLCPQCGANLNEGPCNCERDDIDPRLAALRSFQPRDEREMDGEGDAPNQGSRSIGTDGQG